jgi:Biotin-(acetyl-CoA carboxylase) ligase
MTIKFNDKNNTPVRLIIGLLICESISSVSRKKINARLKWPNDLLIHKQKICGILFESHIINDEIKFISGIRID